MGVTVRAQSQQQWLLVSDDTKLGGKGRVLETYLSKEGLEVQPQIASFFPTHETSLLTCVRATVSVPDTWTYKLPSQSPKTE